MELETLFTEQKWNILKSLSKGSFSPLQLSSQSNTSMANISQQLRLLEASSLVGKRKIPNRDKGKPRSLYHLSKDFAYLIQVSDGFADKKLLDLDPHQKARFTLWFLKQKNLQYVFEKWFWKIEAHLPQITGILLIEQQLQEQDKKLPVYIITTKPPELKKKLGSIEIKDASGSTKTIVSECISIEQLKAVVKKNKNWFEADANPLLIYDKNHQGANAIRESL